MAEAKPVAAPPELTTRSIIVGLLVAVVIGSAYPYCVLKLGFGPNLSVVSAFFGFIALVLIMRAAGTNARENNIVQTMGTSAGQTAFMCVLLAAFDMLNAKGVLNPPIHLGTLQIFCWLCSASLLGILLAVPMRRHYIDEENLLLPMAWRPAKRSRSCTRAARKALPRRRLELSASAPLRPAG
jgi:uncharacterized oligopeptide transporter (OPT) family protein